MHYLVFLLFLVIPTAFAQANTIHFVLSKDEPIYQQAQQHIQAALHPSEFIAKQETHIIDSFSTESLPATDLIVVIGNEAALNIAKRGLKNSTIFGFVDNAVVADLTLDNAQHQWAAIPLNQSIEHLITVADQLIEDNYKTKILVVLSQDNQQAITKLNGLDRLKNGRLEIVKIADGELAAKKIEPYLFDTAVLVAVHDKQIWSGNSAKWLLQQAFTHQVPVIGYSKKFLVAGALISVYSPVDAITNSCAELINKWVKTGSLDEQGVIYPKATIDINANIARSLHIPIAKTNALSINE